MMQLGEVIFVKLNKTEVTERIPTPISEKEMDGLNYLAGYVIQKLMKKMKKHKDEKQAEKQAVFPSLIVKAEGDVLLKLTTYEKLMWEVFQVS